MVLHSCLNICSLAMNVLDNDKPSFNVTDLWSELKEKIRREVIFLEIYLPFLQHLNMF